MSGNSILTILLSLTKKPYTVRTTISIANAIQLSYSRVAGILLWT